MIESVEQGICNKLYELFDGCTVYRDELPRDCVLPTFWIVEVRSSSVPKRYPFYERSSLFDIRYIPKTLINKETEELNAIAENLFIGLEMIECDSKKIRGSDMSCNITGDVLHFMVTYKFFVTLETTKSEYMQTLDLHGGVINGE